MSGTDEASEDIASKILHLLKIYPIISPAMLQAGIGPSIKSSVWRPVLKGLVSKGTVVESSLAGETHTGRFNTYTMLSLADTRCVTNL